MLKQIAPHTNISLKLYIALYIIATAVTGCTILDRWMFKDFLAGQYFYGKGKINIEYNLKGLSSKEIHSEELEYDSIRINNHGKDPGSDWHINVNGILVTHNATTKKTTMYISIDLKDRPEEGTVTSNFLFGPRMKIEIWSPEMIITDKNSKEKASFIAEMKMHKGSMTFTRAEPHPKGNLTGYFHYTGNDGWIKGSFNFVLEKSPLAIFPPWN